MAINNEHELIELIKKKEYSEIIEIFKANTITPEHFNYFRETLSYLVRVNASIDILKYILEQQQQQQQQHQQQKINNINNVDALFYSVKMNNFNIAKLIIRNGTPIERKNSQSKNIMEYLADSGKIDTQKLLFIMNFKKDTSLITGNVLCRLIEKNDLALIKEIFQYPYYDSSFILDMLFLYKNQNGLSKEEFQHFIDNTRQETVNINEKNITGDFPLLLSVSKIKGDMVHALMDYAQTNRILLNINEKNRYNGLTAILSTVYRDDLEMTKLLLDYAEKNNIILNINEKDSGGIYPLLIAANSGNIEMVQLLIDYANKNKFILNINDKSSQGYFPLLCASRKDYTDIIQILFNYAEEHHIILSVNEKNIDRDYPLLWATQKNNLTVVKLIIDYVSRNNILLTINDDENDGYYPFLLATKNNNTEMVELLMDYADKNNIILNINDSNINEDYPLLLASKNNNDKIIQLIIHYAKKNKIDLKLDDKDLKRKVNKLNSSCTIF